MKNEALEKLISDWVKKIAKPYPNHGPATKMGVLTITPIREDSEYYLQFDAMAHVDGEETHGLRFLVQLPLDD